MMTATSESPMQRGVDAICVLGLLSWIFWPLVVFMLGVSVLLYIARLLIATVLVLAAAGAFLLRSVTSTRRAV